MRYAVTRVVLSLTLYFALSALSNLSYTFPGAVPQAFIFRAVGAPIPGFHSQLTAATLCFTSGIVICSSNG
jgi:hypothetical protein